MKTAKKNTKTEAAPTEETVRIVSTDIVHVSVHNTRQPTEKEVIASGLLGSIENQGQLTPGLGRPHPAKKGHIELAAGACRLVSCKKLGRSYRVIVREMTDAELLDAILTENLQRTDPDPEAEAELIKIRLAEGMTPGEICAKYGKEEIWVKRRMKILTISPKVRKLMKPGGTLAHFTTEMKERVGDMETAVQERLMDEWNFRRATTVEGLSQCVRGLSCSLAGQSWIDDPDTAIKGCGPGCANSDAATLFPDPHTKSACGNCLDSTCFKARRVLAQQKALRVALGDLKMSDVILFSKEWSSGIEFDGKTFKPLDQWDFKDCFTISKKPTDRIGLDVTDLLKIKRVFLIATAKGKGKATGTSSTSAPKETREAKLTGKRLAVMNERIKAALEKAPLPTTVPILQLVALFGTNSNNQFCMKAADAKLWDLVAANKLPRISGVDIGKHDTPENVIWLSVRQVIAKRLFFHKNSDLLISWNRNELEKIAWLIGFDYAGEWVKICTVDVPVPKSWGAGIDAMTLKAAAVAKPAVKAAVKKVAAKKAVKKSAAKKTAKKAA
jgi:ParB/RepB/Spo0J family partition protein